MLEAAVEASTSTDITLELRLAALYLQQVRDTADASFYGRVDTLMDRAQKKQPQNDLIEAVRAQTDLGRHEFIRALEHGKKALGLEPTRAAYYGLIGDAYVELGQDDKAIDSFQQMVDLHPDLGSYSRIAYVRELHGDIDGAIEAFEQAIEAGATIPENLAWTHIQLGDLWLRRDADKAAQYYSDAEELAKKPYAPAEKGLGRVAYRKGDLDQAEKHLLKAFDILPTAEHAIDIADLYLAKDEPDKATPYLTLADLAFKKSANSGVKTELESAVFLADHGLDPERALVQARTAHHDRPSIFGADALGWALAQANRAQEAEPYIKEALRLGEHDPTILYHTGMVRMKQGKTEEGKRLLHLAIEKHPSFSPLAVKQIQEILASK